MVEIARAAACAGVMRWIDAGALIPAVQPSSTSVYEFGRFQCRRQVMSRRQALRHKYSMRTTSLIPLAHQYELPNL
eukprot:347671-Alexandrium_andersonii.AAC.1